MPLQPKPLPAVSVLMELFSYDPDTGAITNKINRTARKAGVRAESRNIGGHLQVYAGRLCFAHRVAWAIYYGKEPSGFIDHINGNPGDNRISNLRDCKHHENMRNRKANSNSTSGINGVHKRKDGRGWRSYISSRGKRINLGTFQNPDDAVSAVNAARKKLHGEFARR